MLHSSAMNTSTPARSAPLPGWSKSRLIKTLGRSMGSTVFICILAIAFFAIRRGVYDFQELRYIMAQNWRLFLVIFVSVVIWDLYISKRRNSRA
jgi:hypothetical protein